MREKIREVNQKYKEGWMLNNFFKVKILGWRMIFYLDQINR